MVPWRPSMTVPSWVHPRHPTVKLTLRPSPATSVKKKPSASATDDKDLRMTPRHGEFSAEKRKAARDSSISNWTFTHVVSDISEKMFFGVPDLIDTPAQKRSNSNLCSSLSQKLFGSIFDSERSSTWLMFFIPPSKMTDSTYSTGSDSPGYRRSSSVDVWKCQ